MRAKVKAILRDKAGNIYRNALGVFFETDEVTPAANVWNARTGGALITQALSNSQGEVEAFLDAPREIIVRAQDNGGQALFGDTDLRVTFDSFDEMVEGFPPAEEIAQLDEAQTFTGVNRFSGVTNFDANVRFKKNPFIDPTHPDFGAIGDGAAASAAADTTGWQNALTECASVGGVVTPPPGTSYLINSTLTMANGGIKGSRSRVGNRQTLTTLFWNGAAGGRILDIGDGSGSNLSWCFVEKMQFFGAPNPSTNPVAGTGIKVANQVDFGTRFEKCWFQGINGDGIHLAAASAEDNIHIRTCRWDTIFGYAIKADIGGSSGILTIDEFMYQPVTVTGERTVGGFLGCFERPSGTPIFGWNIAILHGNMEMNENTTEGGIILLENDSAQTRPQFFLSIDDTQITRSAAGVTPALVHMRETGDQLSLVMKNVNCAEPLLDNTTTPLFGRTQNVIPLFVFHPWGADAASNNDGQVQMIASFEGLANNRMDPDHYYSSSGGAGTTLAPLNARSIVTPIFIGEPRTLNTLGINVTGAGEAGSVIRLGIYRDNGKGKPGALLVDGGTVAGDSTGAKTVVISKRVPPGWYWLCAVVQSAPTTSPTVTAITGPVIGVGHSAIDANNPAGFAQSSVTGALPNPFGATFVQLPSAPRIFVKGAI